MKISELLSSPDKFCKSIYSARTVTGEQVDYDNILAVTWSLYGAFKKCGGSFGDNTYKRLVLAIPPEYQWMSGSLTHFGEDHTYEECLQLAKDAGL